MKTISTLLVLTISFACKAQTPILPRYDNPDFGDIDGAYYKDTLNDYDHFEGSWQYTNGDSLFKVLLQKKEMVYIEASLGGSSYYVDMLIGEYQYVENGVEKVNTLPNMNITYNNPRKHNISGGIITKYNANVPSICIGCQPGEVMVDLILQEPNVEIPGAYIRIYFRYFIENGIEKLETNAHLSGRPSYPIGETVNNNYSIPLDTTFILVKQ